MSQLAFHGCGTEGPPLLLLHGFPAHHGMWRGQLDGLGGIARVIAPDLPGFGRSPAPAVEVRTMDELADSVMALADALGFERFVLGGLSMGGYIAFALARAHRDRLAGLILFDTRAEPDSPAVRSERHATAEQALREGVGFHVERMLELALGPAASPAVRAELEAIMRATPAAGFAAALRGMAERPDSRPGLAALGAVPTLVVCGADDRITPPEGMRAMAAAIPGAELAIVPGGHVAPLEHPDETNEVVARFLARI